MSLGHRIQLRRVPLAQNLCLWAALWAPLCLLWPTLRHLIESRMAFHMLLEFPLLLASGWAAMRWARRFPIVRLRMSPWAALDWHGWTGATLTSCVTAFWMLPLALDATLMSDAMAAVKYLSWWLTGCVLARSWYRMAPEVLLFFVGNLTWMTATAGMLYLDSPARLCVNYLMDDQRTTGVGLIVLALLLGVAALRQAMKPVPEAAWPASVSPPSSV